MNYTSERTQMNRYGRNEIILTHVTFRISNTGKEFAQIEHEIKGQGVRYGFTHEYSSARIAQLKEYANS